MDSAAVDAYIGLGSNVGNRLDILRSALDAITSLPGTAWTSTSSIYESAPVDADGGDYLNAVVQVRTTMTPAEMLAALHAIEDEHGRHRPYVNAPRTLDLDLLLHGQAVSTDASPLLPHPRLRDRAFVLHPLAEIAPGLEIPGLGPVGTLLAAVGVQRIARVGRLPSRLDP